MQVRTSVQLLSVVLGASLIAVSPVTRAQAGTPAVEGTSARSRSAPKPATASSARRARPKKKPKVPPAPPVRDWLLDAHGGLHMAFGGDELGAQATGDGVGAQVGLAFTPLWLGEHALGVGVELGFKYASTLTTSGGGVSLSRYPLVVSARALVSLATHWHLMFAGGPQWDLALKYGYTDPRGEDVEHALGDPAGWMGEFGVLWVTGHFGVTTRVRYTNMSYHVPSQRAPLPPGESDASNLVLVLDVHYLL